MVESTPKSAVHSTSHTSHDEPQHPVKTESHQLKTPVSNPSMSHVSVYHYKKIELTPEQWYKLSDILVRGGMDSSSQAKALSRIHELLETGTLLE